MSQKLDGDGYKIEECPTLSWKTYNLLGSLIVYKTMLHIVLKNRYISKNSIFSQFTRNESIIVQIMMGVFLLEIIVCIFLIRMWFSSDTNLFAMTVQAYNSPGLETQQLMSELHDVHLNPVLNQKIKRTPFSTQFTPQGALITLDRDNIQVFEYQDSESAQLQMNLLLENYNEIMMSKTSVKKMHLYIRNSLIIFYLGNNDNILTALGTTKGLVERLSPQTLSTVAQ